MWQDGVRQNKVKTVRYVSCIGGEIVKWFLALSSNRLLKASIHYANITRCQQAYNSINVRDDQICAGGDNGIDSCSGDSGNNYSSCIM